MMVKLMFRFDVIRAYGAGCGVVVVEVEVGSGVGLKKYCKASIFCDRDGTHKRSLNRPKGTCSGQKKWRYIEINTHCEQAVA
jgi:hypothetical protein